ncbi:MAG: hypothetical protein OEY22_03780 [Candidatus Bathyarchaeota archaeon]|nr:hypothetical protein [Candidatus Bathyarchaeota archaeon]MDH5786852.1 hypothetical protein [Candidatus Bathyarchaeota archaeon]
MKKKKAAITIESVAEITDETNDKTAHELLDGFHKDMIAIRFDLNVKNIILDK